MIYPKLQFHVTNKVTSSISQIIILFQKIYKNNSNNLIKSDQKEKRNNPVGQKLVNMRWVLIDPIYIYVYEYIYFNIFK